MAELRIAVSELDTKEHIHDLMTRLLDVPSYYGLNFDALYDVLGDIREDTDIRVDYEGKKIPELPSITRVCLRVFFDAARENPHLHVENAEE